MAKVKGVSPAGNENVYNMKVDNHHNYSVNGGFILHNCDALRYFATSRMVASSEPESAKRYNFEFERKQDEDGFSKVLGDNFDEDFFNYGG